MHIVARILTAALAVAASAAYANTDDVLAASTVCVPVSIVSHPSFVTILPGSSTTLSIVISGTAPITYQWYTGTSGNTGNLIPNATSSSVTVTPVSTITAYWVHVANSCNTIGANSTTGVVTLSATCPSPTIEKQPTTVSAGIGTVATLKIDARPTATGVGTAGPLHYQWYKGTKGDLSKKVGLDSDTFITDPVSVTASYWVRVSAECVSSIDSNAATVTATVSPRSRAVKH
ncbi:MAG: hypothetical protein QOC81_2000 [Thermoanaerobaculia bacterium]|jgi:hypothetical protein|nr:hypothetical protein [Thermoanaerobaculia bacterium]